MPFDGNPTSVTANHLLWARQRLINEGWSSNGAFGPRGERCMALALAKFDVDPEISCQSDRFLLRALGIDNDGGSITVQIGDWNDTPGRTLEEVLAAFDRAIALAETA